MSTVRHFLLTTAWPAGKEDHNDTEWACILITRSNIDYFKERNVKITDGSVKMNEVSCMQCVKAEIPLELLVKNEAA